MNISIPQHIIDLKPYVPGKPIEELQKEYGFSRIIKLASNENPVGVSPLAIQAMFSAIYQLNRYPDIASLLLRQKLSEFFNVPSANIITGHGSEAIIQTIIRAFVADDEEVLTVNGTFVGFYVISKARGVQMNLVPLKDYHFDLNAIAEAVTPKTKCIYLVNPNNPTGTIFTKNELNEFLNSIPDNIIVIVDEAYFEFVKDNPVFPNTMEYHKDNVITLRSFSKAYGLAGIRLGYGFAHQDLVSYMLKVRLPFEPGIPSQAAGVAALLDTQFLEYYLNLNRQGIKFHYDLYDTLGVNYIKTEANFIMIDFETEDRVNQINDKLLRKGVIIRPLRPFGLPHCLRVTIGTPEENEIFAKHFKTVI